MNNLELYWGPRDGALMEMPVTTNGYGETKRPAVVNFKGAEYRIFSIKDMPDKKPQAGVKYIGVFNGKSE